MAGIQAVQAGRTWISPNVDGLLVANGDNLTEGERRLLCWLAQGRTNEYIVSQTARALRTVKRDLSILYEKLNVNGRAEAAAWAARHGLDKE